MTVTERPITELWSRLEAFPLDDPTAAFPFSARLAQENGWSPAFAQRTMLEYKRFLLLLVVAGHPVTPSVAVDQVWHLHLTYTRSYWNELCGQVVQRPIHHDPTSGGAREDAKFRDWYAQTLVSYTRLFGPPPADIWPTVSERFAAAEQPVQVSRRTHWVLRKPSLFKRMTTGGTFSGVVVVGAGGDSGSCGDGGSGCGGCGGGGCGGGGCGGGGCGGGGCGGGGCGGG